MLLCNLSEYKPEDIIDKLFSGFDIDSKDIIESYNINANKVQGEHNLKSSIDFHQKIIVDKNWEVISRCIYVGMMTLKIKIEKLMEPYIDFSKPYEPVEKKNSTIFSCYKYMDEILQHKMVDLENEFDKKLGIQVFLFEAKISKNIHIQKTANKLPENITGLDFSIYFQPTKIDARLVNMENII